MADIVKIPGELESVATGNKVVDVANVKDKTKGNKSQFQINAEYEAALSDRYTKEETYNKEEVEQIITPPNPNYKYYATYADMVEETSHPAGAIYRVSSYDGTQVDAASYAEYTWNGSEYKLLAVKSQVNEIFDITVYNSNTKYADLTAALGVDGANVPESIRRGGMSIKFIQDSAQSSDNKYVQYRLMSDSFNTIIANWQGVDDEPTVGSENLVKSGGVTLKEHYIDEIEPIITLLNTDKRSEDGIWCNYLNGQYQRDEYVKNYSYYAPCIVKENTTYARNENCGQFGTVFFDKNMNFISGVTTDVFTTPSNAVYAVLNTTNYVSSNQVLIERDSAYNETTEGNLYYKTKLKHGDYVSTNDFNTTINDFNTTIANKVDKQDFDTFVYDLTGENQYPVKNGDNTWVALNIIAGQKYSVKNNTSGYIAMSTYSQDKQTQIQSLAGALAGQTYTFTASADAYYLLMYGSAAGTADITDYSSFIHKTESDINSLNIAVAENNVKALITTGDNVFNNQWGELGKWCNYSNGNFESNEYVTNYKCSDYIEVMPSTNYSRAKNRGQFGSVFFDANKTFISGVQTDTFTTPSNCKYVVINVSSDVGFKDVVVKGTYTISDIAEYPYYNKFVYEKPTDELLKIGIGTKYPTIKEGFEYAVTHNLGVEIKHGTYDLVEEGISGIGYILPKKVVGYGVTLICNLPKENWELSPLNCDYTNPLNVEVYGLKVVCSNCRYNIHDDLGAMQRGSYYHHIFKDLTLIHNSSPSAVLIAPNNIGGGFGDAGEILVENCIMESKNTVNSDYHSSFAEIQTDGCKAVFKDCVMNKTVTAAPVGTDDSYMNKVYVTNCICGTIPQSGHSVNNSLLSWNNVANN